MVTLNSIVVRTGSLMDAPMGSGVVILNPAHDNYVALDEIGRQIWESLREPRPVQELCRQAADSYQGDSGQIFADVLAFLNELAADGLVHVAQE